jgi:hypothetical protein
MPVVQLGQQASLAVTDARWGFSILVLTQHDELVHFPLQHTATTSTLDRYCSGVGNSSPLGKEFEWCKVVLSPEDKLLATLSPNTSRHPPEHPSPPHIITRDIFSEWWWLILLILLMLMLMCCLCGWVCKRSRRSTKNTRDGYARVPTRDPGRLQMIATYPSVNDEQLEENRSPGADQVVAA